VEVDLELVESTLKHADREQHRTRLWQPAQRLTFRPNPKSTAGR
jgi:hypothetical protein